MQYMSNPLRVACNYCQTEQTHFSGKPFRCVKCRKRGKGAWRLLIVYTGTASIKELMKKRNQIV